MKEEQLVKVFKRIRPETIDITPSPDMSTIEAIRANWRWPVPCPSDSVLEAELPLAENDDIPNKRQKEYIKEGVVSDKFMEAYFEEREGKPQKMNVLIAKREAVKAKFPKD